MSHCTHRLDDGAPISLCGAALSHVNENAGNINGEPIGGTIGKHPFGQGTDSTGRLSRRPTIRAGDQKKAEDQCCGRSEAQIHNRSRSPDERSILSTALSLPADFNKIGNQMRDSHPDRNHAHILYALRQLLRELVRRETQHDSENNKDPNPEGNIQAAKPEKKALHIPAGTHYLLFQRGKLDPLLDCCQSFPVNHDPAVMLHPLPESHVNGQDTHERDEFHRTFSFRLFILASKAAGCEASKNLSCNLR
jgi:hypothetical protein